MKKWAILLALLLTSPWMFAQTVHTVTQDTCGGKANQYCTMPLNDGSAIMDTRVTGGGPIDTLTLTTTEYSGSVHGTFAGFVANPDGTHNPFSGSASFVSDDGTVTATFLFDARYVSICSGRGCGGTLGWHYTILLGSTITTP